MAKKTESEQLTALGFRLTTLFEELQEPSTLFSTFDVFPLPSGDMTIAYDSKGNIWTKSGSTDLQEELGYTRMSDTPSTKH